MMIRLLKLGILPTQFFKMKPILEYLSYRIGKYDKTSWIVKDSKQKHIRKQNSNNPRFRPTRPRTTRFRQSHIYSYFGRYDVCRPILTLCFDARCKRSYRINNNFSKHFFWATKGYLLGGQGYPTMREIDIFKLFYKFSSSRRRVRKMYFD